MLRIGIGAPPDREVPSLIEVSDVDELLAHIELYLCSPKQSNLFGSPHRTATITIATSRCPRGLHIFKGNIRAAAPGNAKRYLVVRSVSAPSASI